MYKNHITAETWSKIYSFLRIAKGAYCQNEAKTRKFNGEVVSGETSKSQQMSAYTTSKEGEPDRKSAQSIKGYLFTNADTWAYTACKRWATHYSRKWPSAPIREGDILIQVWATNRYRQEKLPQHQSLKKMLESSLRLLTRS